MCSRWPRQCLIPWTTASTVFLDRRMWTWLSRASGRPARSCWLKLWVFLQLKEMNRWCGLLVASLCGLSGVWIIFFAFFSVVLSSYLSSIQIPPASKSFQEAQSELNQTAADLNQSAGEVVHASRGSSSQLAVASGKFSHDFDEFLDAGIEMAGHTQVSLMSVS